MDKDKKTAEDPDITYTVAGDILQGLGNTPVIWNKL